MITTNTNSIVSRLLGNVLLVEWLEQKQIGAIVLPDGSTHNPEKVGILAIVLMVGNKFEYSKEVGISHRVIVSKYLGTIIDKTKEHIRIYDAEDVLAVIQ